MSDRTRIPIATLLLVAANLIAAFFLLFQPELVDMLGFKASEPTAQSAVTSLFLHANIFHLLGNMVFLAAVGVTVESATGSLRYVLVYFASGLAGVLAHMLVASGDARSVPLIGASGCVAGLIGYYSARYTGVKIHLFAGKAVPIIWITGVWVALQLAGAVVHLGSNSNVSFWAHLGGLATGVLLSLLFKSPDWGHRKLGHEKLDEMNQRSPALQLKAAKKHLETHRGDARALQEWVEAAAKMDDTEEEICAWLAIQSLETDRKDALLRLSDLGGLRRISSLQRRQIADRISPSDPETSSLLLRSILDEPGEDANKPEALFSLIQIKWDADREYAQKLLGILEDHYPHHGVVQVARMRGWVR